jgi:MinD superfamily P-loop ATPase
MVKHMDEGFSVNEKCIRCGICSSVCPVYNITNENDGKPAFNHDCEQCFACVAWCPVQAIDFRKSTVDRRRYHNSEISVDEMIVGEHSKTK